MPVQVATALWADSLPRPEGLVALDQRLRAVAGALGVPAPREAVDPVLVTSALLGDLVTAVRADLTPPRAWLLLVAVVGAFPSADDVDRAVRVLELDDAVDATAWLLAAALQGPPDGREARRLELLEDGVVVDVDHTARNDLHTGIQQVIRETAPRWVRDHSLALAAWHEHGAGLRALTTRERARVVAWAGRTDDPASPPSSDAPLLVPWRCTVVVADAVQPAQVAGLTALARCSGNEVVAIGYDAIPVVSGDQVPWGGGAAFVRYLSAVKWMRRVAGISASATVEFRGFATMLASQGLPGPEVVECLLPWSQGSAVPTAVPAAVPEDPGEAPLVLAVGSLEPRKNQLALLHAADVLWREGVDFRVLLIGGSKWGDEVPARIAALQDEGRPVEQRMNVSPAELAASYAAARVTVFPSTHEGYGLPVAESLAAGTPVITSGYGSTAEIAAAGGALLVDPRDDAQLVAALRSVLTDDAEHERLRVAAVARPSRTWDDYARELWDLLVARGPAPS